MTQYKVINYYGATLIVSSSGEIFREAHTTVDRLGKVHKYPRRQLTAVKEPRTGYMRVGVRIDGTLRNLSVHRAVALAFLGAPAPDQVVNHINENRADNRLENLEWTTQKGNIHHSLALHPEYTRNAAKPVAQIKDGEIIKIYQSARAACRELGLKGSSAINMAARGVTKTSHGFNWRYV